MATDAKTSQAVTDGLELIYRQGFDAGRAQGYAEGIAAAQAYLNNMPSLVSNGVSENPDLPLTALIEELDFSTRTYNILKRDGICTVGELLACTAERLSSLRNFGRYSVDEVIEKLASFGYRLADEQERPA